jgi:hypothetical protein
MYIPLKTKEVTMDTVRESLGYLKNTSGKSLLKLVKQKEPKIYGGLEELPPHLVRIRLRMDGNIYRCNKAIAEDLVRRKRATILSEE